MGVVHAVNGGRRILELLGGFAEAPSKLGQLRGAEQEHDDCEDDDEFGRSQIQSRASMP